VTAYDYTTARILDAAAIPVLLVGDSLGMLMLGYPSTLPVSMEEMLHHARAVARGAPTRLLVGDMPFDAYHASDAEAVHNAAAFPLVLEGVPRDLAAEVTAALRIPTIGIGAGPDCDAQVLVVHDLLGLTQDPMPKFVRSYGSLGDQAKEALTAFAADVAAG